ncbi:hypothetical protein, partial [uncultured Brachyspira sp.]|uniref:hypothetical protein n=1 Tax=uncultured Brachyspira sp. TaxID=221953 RepID=UPI0026294317
LCKKTIMYKKIKNIMQNIVNGLKMRTYNEDKKVFSSVKFGILRKNIKNFLISRKLVTQRN